MFELQDVVVMTQRHGLSFFHHFMSVSVLTGKKKNMMASAFDKISSLIIKTSLFNKMYVQSRQSFRLVICLRSLCLFLPLELQLLYVGRALANHSLSQLSDILTVTNCLSVFI